MNLYYFTFTGRQLGAIGITSPCNDEIKAETLDAAFSALYEKYEHISRPTWTVWGEDGRSIASGQGWPGRDAEVQS